MKLHPYPADKLVAGIIRSLDLLHEHERPLRRRKLIVAPTAAAILLNHVSGSRSGIVGVYQKHTWRDEGRLALEAWSRRLREIETSEAAAANVVAFAKSKA